MVRDRAGVSRGGFFRRNDLCVLAAVQIAWSIWVAGVIALTRYYEHEEYHAFIAVQAFSRGSCGCDSRCYQIIVCASRFFRSRIHRLFGLVALLTFFAIIRLIFGSSLTVLP